jgi:hypothetical protein
MSEGLLGMNAVIALVLLLIALLTGYGAGSIAFHQTVSGMRRTAKLNLALLALLGALALFNIALFIFFYSYNWLYIWDKVLLFVPLIVLPSIAIAIFSVPRLLDIARLSEAYPLEEANRTKRRSAAEAALVVPVQSLTVGSIIYTVKNVYPLPQHFVNQLLIIGVVFFSAAALLSWRQSIRRRRIHRDDGTSAIHWMKRIGVYTTSGLLLTFTIIFTVSNAKTDGIIPERIGKHKEVDYGGDFQLVSSGLNSRSDYVSGSQTTLSNPADLTKPLNVKQTAVKPGETFTYRFTAEQARVYWYHYLQSFATN